MTPRAGPWCGLCAGVAVVPASCGRAPAGELRSGLPGIGSSVQQEPSGLGAGPVLIWIGVVAMLVAAIALVVATVRAKRRTPPPVPERATVPVRLPVAPVNRSSPDDGLRAALHHVARSAPGVAIAEQIDRLLAGAPERGALVDACIRFRHQLGGRDAALSEYLRDALGRAGVAEITAEGAAFDTSHHEAVGTTPASDPGLHGRVAEVVRPGYRDGDHVVTPSRVVVYGPEGVDQ
jgi:hypothetical protein